jgi:hypothetical protein
MATPGVLANVSPDALIERIYNGAIPAHLAESIGAHKCSVYRHLADHPEYQRARKTGMAVRLDDAEHAVATADERTLARAREVWRCVTWRAEREHPDVWGPKQQSITINVLRVDSALGGSAADLLSRLQMGVTLGVTHDAAHDDMDKDQ